MKPLKTDLSIYEKFDFERPPIGIKYLFFKPGPEKPHPGILFHQPPEGPEYVFTFQGQGMAAAGSRYPDGQIIRKRKRAVFVSG